MHWLLRFLEYSLGGQGHVEYTSEPILCSLKWESRLLGRYDSLKISWVVFNSTGNTLDSCIKLARLANFKLWFLIGNLFWLSLLLFKILTVNYFWWYGVLLTFIFSQFSSFHFHLPLLLKLIFDERIVVIQVLQLIFDCILVPPGFLESSLVVRCLLFPFILGGTC